MHGAQSVGLPESVSGPTLVRSLWDVTPPGTSATGKPPTRVGLDDRSWQRLRSRSSSRTQSELPVDCALAVVASASAAAGFAESPRRPSLLSH